MMVDFRKMHGAGNDFVLLDARSDVSVSRLVDCAKTVARLADRHCGIGFDQLVLLLPGDEPGAVRARFFNPDGGESGACGNATRCIANMVGNGEPGRVVRVQTAAGTLEARLLGDGRVEVDMGAPGLGWRDVPLAGEADTLVLPIPGEPAACSMGNPHATFFDTALEPERDGDALEHHALFPERANIGFATMLGPERMRLVVWERGAGLTLACGSGACGAVVNAVRRGLGARRMAVEMPGGELEIEWREADGRVRMTGPVATAFTGRVSVPVGAEMAA